VVLVEVQTETNPQKQETIMTLYCGIDLHSNNSVVAVLDEQDRTVYEKRLPNDLETIIEVLCIYQAELAACVVESTYNWYWLVDGLMAAGFVVRLAHTSALPEYSGLKYSNDFSDARHLAHLLRLGLLPTGYIYPKEERALRDLLRRRLLLVRQRSLHHVSLQSLIARHSGQRLNTLQIKMLTRKQLADYLQGHALLGGEITRQARCWLETAVKRIDGELQRHIKPREDYQLLQSIPGVGPVLGTTIALETGTIERFASAGNYASYARCVKSEKISNGKYKGQGNKKNGNKYLAWAFMEAGHYGAIWNPRINRYYQRKKAKAHIMVAKKAVANKLARACYHMLKRGEVFDVTRAFS
jgi:transposase